MAEPEAAILGRLVTSPVPTAVIWAKAATRWARLPRRWRSTIFCTPEADRTTFRSSRCSSSRRAPKVGRATASARTISTMWAGVALGMAGDRRPFGIISRSAFVDPSAYLGLVAGIAQAKL